MPCTPTDTIETRSHPLRVAVRLNSLPYHGLREGDHRLDEPEEARQVMEVEEWATVHDPVVAKCRCCGYRGHVDTPTIGLQGS